MRGSISCTTCSQRMLSVLIGERLWVCRITAHVVCMLNILTFYILKMPVTLCNALLLILIACRTSEAKPGRFREFYLKEDTSEQKSYGPPLDVSAKEKIFCKRQSYMLFTMWNFDLNVPDVSGKHEHEETEDTWCSCKVLFWSWGLFFKRYVHFYIAKLKQKLFHGLKIKPAVA